MDARRGPAAQEGGSADSGSLDPIFQGEERVERATPRATLLFQFFLFPLLIVVASVGVFLFFGAIGGSEKTPSQYLDLVVSGGENEQKQSAHQLGAALEKERRRVEAKEIPLEKAFYVQDKAFRAKLRDAFDASFTDRSPERQIFLAASLGFVGDPDYRASLESRIAPTTPVEVRRAVARALGLLQTDATGPALAGLLKDPDEPVRNLAVLGLSRQGTPVSLAALKTALGDDSVFVQANAAAALAVLGDDSGKALVAHLLDPAWVDRTVGTSAAGASGGGADRDAPVDQTREVRAAALQNGIRGAFALKATDLRPRVEALQSDRDEDVRRLARDVLDRWPSSR